MSHSFGVWARQVLQGPQALGAAHKFVGRGDENPLAITSRALTPRSCEKIQNSVEAPRETEALTKPQVCISKTLEPRCRPGFLIRSISLQLTLLKWNLVLSNLARLVLGTVCPRALRRQSAGNTACAEVGIDR